MGVSSINLCLPDCSWVEERAFDLLPFDAGTDNGDTYMVSEVHHAIVLPTCLQSPNNPAEPRIPIAPITTKSTKHLPFYDPNSEEIPPMGRLIIKRKAVLSNTCRPTEEYKREAFNATNTSEDEEYKDRSEDPSRSQRNFPLFRGVCCQQLGIVVAVLRHLRKRHSNALAGVRLPGESADVPLPSSDHRATVLQCEAQRVRELRSVQHSLSGHELGILV